MRGLFRGLSMSFLGMTHPVVYFLVYEFLKKGGQHSSASIFVIAGVAKVTACCTTYPHVVVRSWLQDCGQSSTVLRVAGQIYRRHGLPGFYKGMSADLVRLVPTNGIMFITYEKVKLLSRP